MHRSRVVVWASLALAILFALWPGVARAVEKPPAAVYVVGPGDAATHDRIVAAARAGLSDKGYDPHDALNAEPLSVAGELTSLLGESPKEALRQRFGGDVVLVIRATAESDGRVTTEIAVTGGGAPAVKRATFALETLDAQLDALITALVPAATPPARSDADVVYLVDGTTVSGLVTAQEPGKYVTIVPDGGGEQTISWSSVSRVEISPAHQQKPVLQRHDGGVGLEVGGVLESAEAKRRAWKQRGGGIVSYALQAQASGILMPETSIPCIAANGLPAPGAHSCAGRGGGGGGGVGLRVAYLWLSLPDPESASHSWIAFKVGTGLDASFFTFQQPTVWHCSGTSCSDGSADYAGGSSMNFAIPFQLGTQIGLGGFGDAAHWKGLVLGLSYAPSYSYTKPSQGDGSGSFNPAGFEVTFDTTSLEAKLDEMAKQAHFRVTVFILPPVSSDLPLFGSLGFGAVWY
jgi:hypothetical protein